MKMLVWMEVLEYIVIARGGGIPTEGVATESVDVMMIRVIDGTALALAGGPAGATHGTVIRESIVLEEDMMGADENGTPLRCAAVAAVAATDGGDRARSARRRVPSKRGV